METPLTPIQVRVLGSLIEKELTTPEYYPLTLAALTAACKQKSNRSPVMLQLTDAEVIKALDSLRDLKLAWVVTTNAARVPKYRQGATETLALSPPQIAILGELALRGPQTAAELRIHASRMVELPSTEQVMTVLDELIQRPDGALVARLGRAPGQREERFAHLLSGAPEAVDISSAANPESIAPSSADGNARLEKLENEVTLLREELAAIKAELASVKIHPAEARNGTAPL
jgi:uncharacterized protein YceH (UPF0502 family)